MTMAPSKLPPPTLKERAIRASARAQRKAVEYADRAQKAMTAYARWAEVLDSIISDLVLKGERYPDSTKISRKGASATWNFECAHTQSQVRATASYDGVCIEATAPRTRDNVRVDQAVDFLKVRFKDTENLRTYNGMSRS